MKKDLESGEKGADAMVQNKTSSNMKYWSLVILIFQNASLILTIRYSRTLSGDMYISSTAVVFAELLKVLVCLVLTYNEVKDVNRWLNMLYTNIIGDPLTTLKVAVPSLVYVIQNNLQYVAISNLDAATFQVTYQLKVLTTALFSVFMLGKKLSSKQWVSLFMLFVGIAMVQLQPSMLQAKKTEVSGQNPYVGFIAVLVSSLCSGFAGVYFEKILKGSGKGPAGSVWLRNIQMGSVGVLLGIGGMMVSDYSKIQEKGVFFGYTLLVWIIILMQAFGGLLVAVVVKYADNILKGFATSFAIIVSCIVSIYLFNFILSIQFVLGTVLVMTAIYLYSQ
ncbi:UDP-galactose translocator-like [Clytia hemisphaerica]|uniref:Uncharacterized protein n=1 Tax=Clytia hemisphaerica TaxID=252671 RepID=A0A7M6DQZ5_9CNID|eukprot:TCONS_00046274-protein